MRRREQQLKRLGELVMYELHVTLFGLVSYYVGEFLGMVLSILTLGFITILGFRHLRFLYRHIVAAEELVEVRRND
jgi:hypothetical protein